MRRLTTQLALIGLPILAGCSSEALMAGDESAEAPREDMSDGTSESDEDGGLDWDEEPEVEEELKALPPATTPLYTFVANPDRDTLTRIAVDDLSVITTPPVDRLSVRTFVCRTTDQVVRDAIMRELVVDSTDLVDALL